MEENIAQPPQQEPLQETIPLPSNPTKKGWYKYAFFGLIGIIVVMGLAYTVNQYKFAQTRSRGIIQSQVTQQTPNNENEVYTCSIDSDCTPVYCNCYCSGGGGFPYEEIINKHYEEWWYESHNCTKPTICNDEGCKPVELTCSNNTCDVKTSDENVTACPMDAKLCPDGTAVGRMPPNCEFEQCPSGKQASSKWQTYINHQYKFQIQLPPSWKDYKVKESAVAVINILFYFELPDTCLNLEPGKHASPAYYPFYIQLQTPDQWTKLVESGAPTHEVLGENNEYVFRAIIDQGQPDCVKDIDYQVDGVLDTFELL